MTTQTIYRETLPARTIWRRLQGLWAVLALCSAGSSAYALAPGVGAPKTTIVIFSDLPMTEPAWAGLFTQLRREAAAEAREFPVLDAEPLLVRGADVAPGLLMDNPVVVKLHGACRPSAGIQAFPSGAALGWVLREEGHISPFIHIDCTRVAQLLSPRVLWMKNGEKSPAICGAIARVILHEWIHIAEQTDQHGRKGITKPQFGSNDLISVPDPQIADAEHPRGGGHGGKGR